MTQNDQHCTMIVLYALCVAVSFMRCSANTVESITQKLTYLTEKYDQLDKKLELITVENVVLKARVGELSKENIDIKSRLKLLEEPDIRGNVDVRKSILNETTRYTTQHNQEVGPIEEKSDTAQNEIDARNIDENVSTNHRRLLLPACSSTNTTKVAFNAMLTKTLSLGQNQIIEYDKVITNVGNAYDSRHGHFTAPTRAVYLMACTMMNKSGGVVGIEMVKNGVVIGRMYGDSSDYNMGTQVAIVLLEKDDMVWIKHGEENHGSQTLHFAEYNTFSGTILFQL